MAVDPCQRRSPLVRSGLTQTGRARAELQPGHFLPDERDLADLVLFGQRFAKHVRYYDATNTAAGDWTDFFESDVTASLAALSKLPLESFRTFQRDLETWLKADPARAPAALSAHMLLVFHIAVALLEVVGAHHARLPSDHPFVGDVQRLVERDLADPLRALIGWYKGGLDFDGNGAQVFADADLAPSGYNVAGGPADPRVRLSTTLAETVLGRPRLRDAAVPPTLLARLTPPDFAAFYAASPADPSPYLDAAGAPNRHYEQIYDALTYNLLTTAVERVYQGLERIRRDAAGHLAESLEKFGAHPPHYALWLAFLQIFGRAQHELNTFTARHLDFYFRDVLRLGARAAVPDQAHLLFQLAKGRETALLTAGTLFRAGKDALGRPVSYALDSDIVVNRGSVAELRGVRVEVVSQGPKRAERVRAAPVVRSRDGLGEL